MNDVPYASTFIRCAMKLESPQEKPKTETLSEKELVSNKIQIKELSGVKLNARCSAILQNELPPKEKDPGSFVLPCIIGNTTVSNALADLEASISVMSFSMFKRLDFVILDIIKDNKVPIILGRPILATSHARIDVFGGKISLEVGKEQVIFNANVGATPVTVSHVCAIIDFDVIDNIKGPYDLEEFLMDDELNGDLGNFRQDNNLIPNYENPGDNPPSPNNSSSRNWNPIEEFQDYDDNLGIGIEDFIAIDDLWDNLDPGSLMNKQPLKLEFLSIGNRVNRYNPYNLQITCKIGVVNFNPYIDPISPFNIMFRAAYNAIIKRELIYTGNNIVGKARNLQVFIGCHSFLTDFIIIENVNEFVEKGLAEVIFGKPFIEKIGLEEDISSIYKEVEFEIKFEGLHASNTPCRTSAIRPRDQDDPPDDAHPEGENSAKRQKTSEHRIYVFGESSSDQANKSETGPSTSGNQEQLDDFDFWKNTYVTDDDELPTEKVSQELVKEMSQTVNEAKLLKVESRKEILVSPYPQKPTSIVQSCQIDPKAPVLSLVNQDLLYLKKGNSGPEKIMLSLHKFPAIIFLDDDIEERTSRWTLGELGNEHKFIIEIIARRGNGSIVSITKPDYKNLNKNDIEDMYLLIVYDKHGYVTLSLNKEDDEYLRLFKEGIKERLKHRDQMRHQEDRVLDLRRREEKSLNTLFLGEYECFSFALDRRRKKIEDEIGLLETRLNYVSDQGI
ncbi:hypothetical protein Tco_0660464 [Tanacetum coccineum]